MRADFAAGYAIPDSSIANITAVLLNHGFLCAEFQTNIRMRFFYQDMEYEGSFCHKMHAENNPLVFSILARPRESPT